MKKYFIFILILLSTTILNLTAKETTRKIIEINLSDKSEDQIKKFHRLGLDIIQHDFDNKKVNVLG